MPPHRTMGFNSQITIDDALLLSEYIDEQQLTYEEAGKALHKDVANLRHELSSKGTVRFGELGTFSMNVTGNITFDENGDANKDAAYLKQVVDGKFAFVKKQLDETAQ